MRIDDITWALNRSTGNYEIYAYGSETGLERVITLEIGPMQLHSLAVKLAQTVERDFPPRNPVLDITSGENDEESGTDNELSKRQAENR